VNNPQSQQPQSQPQDQPTYTQPKIYVNVQAPAQPQPHVNTPQASPHSQGMVLLIWFFFGIVGGHHFLVGRMGTGLLYLCTGGILGIGWIIDLCSILGGTFTDAYGRPVVA
jgi:TM2 domain-containing membrane protein YozV